MRCMDNSCVFTGYHMVSKPCLFETDQMPLWSEWVSQVADSMSITLSLHGDIWNSFSLLYVLDLLYLDYVCLQGVWRGGQLGKCDCSVHGDQRRVSDAQDLELWGDGEPPNTSARNQVLLWKRSACSSPLSHLFSPHFLAIVNIACVINNYSHHSVRQEAGTYSSHLAEIWSTVANVSF